MGSTGTERLSEADRKLAQASPLWSLCPGRERATALSTLADTLLEPGLDAALVSAFADGLAGVAEAVLRNFPGNLFWDFDYFAKTLLDAPRVKATTGARAHAPGIAEICAVIVALQDLFSHRSNIQFRYAHDFLYGFDWAKWVARDLASRLTVGPFDPAFVRGMHERGSEILALIAQKSDEKYPDLPHGHDRNPFRFSREPDAERLLHRDLAEHGLIPVEAWSTTANPTWNRPYAESRKQRAHALGLQTRVRQS